MPTKTTARRTAMAELYLRDSENSSQFVIRWYHRQSLRLNTQISIINKHRVQQHRDKKSCCFLPQNYLPTRLNKTSGRKMNTRVNKIAISREFHHWIPNHSCRTPECPVPEDPFPDRTSPENLNKKQKEKKSTL